MLGRLNISKKIQSGGGSSLNLFAQSSEPETKKGIWINTSAIEDLPEISKFEYEGVELASDDYYKGDKYVCQRLPSMPFEHPNQDSPQRICSIGTYIYTSIRFTPAAYIYQDAIVQYDTITSTYKIIQLPSAKYYASEIVAVGNNIYLVGGGGSANNKKFMLKYDTVNDEIVELTDLPVQRSAQEDMEAVLVIGKYIYIWYSHLNIYRYDTENDTYEQLSTMELDGAGYGLDYYPKTTSCIAIIDGFMYHCRNKIMAKYDIVNDTYTQLSSPPSSRDVSCFLSTVDNDIYFRTNYNEIYKYDTLNDTYTLMVSNLPGLGMPPYITVAKPDGFIMIGTNTDKARKIYFYKYSDNSVTEIGCLEKDALSYLTRNTASRCYTVIGDDIYIGSNNGIYNVWLYRIAYKEFYNNFVQLMLRDNFPETEISDGLSLPVRHACICQNGSLKKYPAYYGDGTQWNLMPD